MEAELRVRCAELERQLAAAVERAEGFETAVDAANERAAALESSLAREREIRQAIEEASADGSFVATIERIIDRHAFAMEAANTGLENATMRHERPILELIGEHRREVAEKLEYAINQNSIAFAQVVEQIENTWAERGTTKPSADNEHWLLLAREESEDEEGNAVVTFKIRSGQKKYIDRVARTSSVVLAQPAANGVDTRQIVKKRLRVTHANNDGFDIQALKFTCFQEAEADEFLGAILEAIEDAISPPFHLINIKELMRQSTQNFTDAFDIQNLFTDGTASPAA